MSLMDSYFAEPEKREQKGISEEELRSLKEELEKVRKAQEALARERDALIEENSNLGKEKAEAEAKAREAELKAGIPRSKQPTQDSALCIRINETRKEYCRIMAKSMKLLGGCTGYINYLIREDMMRNRNVTEQAEASRGYDIPYDSRTSKDASVPKRKDFRGEEDFFSSSSKR